MKFKEMLKLNKTCYEELRVILSCALVVLQLIRYVLISRFLVTTLRALPHGAETAVTLENLEKYVCLVCSLVKAPLDAMAKSMRRYEVNI